MPDTEPAERPERSSSVFHRHAPEQKNDGLVDVAEPDPEIVMLHPTEAGGDPYYIGDAYDDQPIPIAQEWEIVDT
jgi:hypothetical protein